MSFLSNRQKMGAAALLLAASAFLSRLMGLLRDKIISWQYGAGGEADMYFAAFVVPDIINYLLAGGFVSITIIPVLASLFEKDEGEAWRFFSCILFWMSLSASLLTSFCMVFANSLAHAIAPGFTSEQLSRLAFFTRIILPGQIFFLSGACFTALLLLRRQFAAPALTPLIYNGCIILLGVCLPLTPIGAAPDFGMTGYCAGVTLGAFLGALVLPAAIAFKKGMHFSLVLWHPKMLNFLYFALPLMLGQTIVMLDEQFLRVFGSLLGEGNVALLNYGRRIAQVPISLVGQALAAASYPFLVNLLARKEEEKFYNTLNTALGAGLNLIIPCSGLMIATATPIIGVIFLGGRFGPEETAACAPLTQLMLAAAPLWTFYMVVARAFYATGDTITPAVTGTLITLGCIPCYYFLALPLGAWGICVISGLGVGAYIFWLGRIWLKRHGKTAFQGLGSKCGKSLILTGAACAAAIIVTQWLPFAEYPNNILKLGALGICQGLVFLGVFILAGIAIFPGYIASLKNSLKR